MDIKYHRKYESMDFYRQAKIKKKQKNKQNQKKNDNEI